MLLLQDNADDSVVWYASSAALWYSHQGVAAPPAAKDVLMLSGVSVPQWPPVLHESTLHSYLTHQLVHDSVNTQQHAVHNLMRRVAALLQWGVRDTAGMSLPTGPCSRVVPAASHLELTIPNVAYGGTNPRPLLQGVMQL